MAAKRLRMGRSHPGPSKYDPNQIALVSELEERLKSPRLGLTPVGKKQQQQNDAMSTPIKPSNAERQIDRVTLVRKRANRHEYLVKWKNVDEEEWIDRDNMIPEHSSSVIAYFESITKFDKQNETDE